MRAAEQDFRRLDDLVLDLKGLVLVRSRRRREGADLRELEMFDSHIDRVKDALTEFVQEEAAA